LSRIRSGSTAISSQQVRIGADKLTQYLTSALPTASVSPMTTEGCSLPLRRTARADG
jgi:hypothetical protein